MLIYEFSLHFTITFTSCLQFINQKNEAHFQLQLPQDMKQLIDETLEMTRKLLGGFLTTKNF